MSLWNHRLDQNTNENFDSFCPGPFRAEIIKFFVGILVQTKTSKRHFEINWPLVDSLWVYSWLMKLEVRMHYLNITKHQFFKEFKVKNSMALFQFFRKVWLFRCTTKKKIFGIAKCSTVINVFYCFFDPVTLLWPFNCHWYNYIYYTYTHAYVLFCRL